MKIKVVFRDEAGKRRTKTVKVDTDDDTQAMGDAIAAVLAQFPDADILGTEIVS